MKTTLFLRGLDKVWPKFKELAKKSKYIDGWGRWKPMTVNRAVNRLMAAAVKEDRVPTMEEMAQQRIVEFPYPWLPWRPGDPPPKEGKAVLVKNIDTTVKDHFKALCARRGKGLKQALSMLIVLAIMKGKLPKGKAGKD